MSCFDVTEDSMTEYFQDVGVMVLLDTKLVIRESARHRTMPTVHFQTDDIFSIVGLCLESTHSQLPDVFDIVANRRNRSLRWSLRLP